MKKFFFVLLPFIIVYLFTEGASFFILGGGKIIYGTGNDMIAVELDGADKYDGVGPISTNKKSELKLDLIAKTPFGFMSMMPYYGDNYTSGHQTYGIMRWSKAYYLVKKRFEEGKASSDTAVKFK